MTYKFDSNGGFFAADEANQVIEYAYPTSDHAVAARKNPEAVAAKMLAHGLDVVADRNSQTYVQYYKKQAWYVPRYEHMLALMRVA